MKKYKKKKHYLYEAVLLEETKESFSEAYKLLGDDAVLTAATDGTFINYLDCECPCGDIHHLHIGEYIVRTPLGPCKMSTDEFEREFIEAEEADLYED